MTEYSEITSRPHPLRDKTPFSRRNFLVGGTAIGVGVVVTACSSSSKSNSAADSGTSASGTAAPATTPTTAAGGGGDLAIAKVAASLEVLAVGTYKAALDAATAKKLGAVPPAVGEYVTTAMANHQAALEMWNKVITGGGGQAVTQPPADLKATVDGLFAKVTDVTGAAKLALTLETIAADTYLAVLPKLKDKAAITFAGAQQVSDQNHAAILHYVLGEYPVPDVFQKTDMAYMGTGAP
ncbi:MAG: hypothetical protein NVS3B21_32850 [Acidimicrobiales bacterium]